MADLLWTIYPTPIPSFLHTHLNKCIWNPRLKDTFFLERLIFTYCCLKERERRAKGRWLREREGWSLGREEGKERKKRNKPVKVLPTL